VTFTHLLLPEFGSNHQALYQQGIASQSLNTKNNDNHLSNLIPSTISPTKIVYLVGHELLAEQGIAEIDETLRHIEYSCAYLMLNSHETKSIPIIIAPMFLQGERQNQANEFDEEFEEIQGKLKTLSKFHQFSFLDLTSALFKAIECWNIDNQRSGILTYDGKILNPRGHAVIANAIITAFGMSRNPSEQSLLQAQYGFIWDTADCPTSITHVSSAASGSSKRRLAAGSDPEDENQRRLIETAISLNRNPSIKSNLKKFFEVSGKEGG